MNTGANVIIQTPLLLAVLEPPCLTGDFQ